MATTTSQNRPTPGEVLYLSLFESSIYLGVPLPSELDYLSLCCFSVQALDELHRCYDLSRKATWSEPLREMHDFLLELKNRLIGTGRSWGTFARLHPLRRKLVREIKSAHCYRQSVLQGEHV